MRLSIRPILRRLLSLRAVSAACSCLALIVLLKGSADTRANAERIRALEVAFAALPSNSSPVPVAASAPALPDGDAGRQRGGLFDGLERCSAPSGWRYSIARGRPCLVLPSGRYLFEGTVCSFGRIVHILPDCVVTDTRVLEFFNDSRAI